MMNRGRDSDDYKVWRTAVYRRDKGKCQMPSCNSRVKLHAHHIVPWSLSYARRFDVSNGILLCKRCHKKVTGYELLYAPLFRSLIDNKTR